MRAKTKCMFHCSDVREPESLLEKVHLDNVSLREEKLVIPTHHHQHR